MMNCCICEGPSDKIDPLSDNAFCRSCLLKLRDDWLQGNLEGMSDTDILDLLKGI